MDLNLDINKRLFLLFSFLGSTVHVFFSARVPKKSSINGNLIQQLA